MRLSLAIVVLLFAVFTTPLRATHAVRAYEWAGVLGSEEHVDPSGGKVEGAVITLTAPWSYKGRSYASVQLILSELYLTRWHELAGRHAIVSCTPERGTLWAHDHLMCAPESIKVEP